MTKLEDMQQLLEYLKSKQHSKELSENMLFAMYTILLAKDGGAKAFIAIADNDIEQSRITDGMSEELTDISSQISDLAVGIASACSSSWFTNEAIRTLTDEKEQEEHDLNIAVEQLNLLQAPNYRRITKCADELLRLVDDSENIGNIQNALRRLNVSINVDNERILLDVDLNAFVGGVLPVRFALCENRDNIALVGNNERLKYNIATLGKRIQDGLPHIGK